MYVPHGPLWCWNLQGEDTVFFSQPTHYCQGSMRTFVFGGSAACAARCQFVSCLEEIDGSCRTYDVQCGYVAQLTADGTYLCFLHAPDEHKGTCAWCDELHAAGSLKACPGCHATWKANGWPDWCCDEMDAPAGEEE